jgi:hypothetical protein
MATSVICPRFGPALRRGQRHPAQFVKSHDHERDLDRLETRIGHRLRLLAGTDNPRSMDLTDNGDRFATHNLDE